jgi:hypothetical protein
MPKDDHPFLAPLRFPACISHHVLFTRPRETKQRLALQIVQRLAIRIQHAEGGAAGVVLKRIPEGIVLSDDRAADRRPIGLSVCLRRDRGAEVSARYRPAGLCDPDWLSRRHGGDSVLHDLDALVEDVVGVGYGGALPVGVAVGANEVAGLSDVVVCGVYPGCLLLLLVRAPTR